MTEDRSCLAIITGIVALRLFTFEVGTLLAVPASARLIAATAALALLIFIALLSLVRAVMFLAIRIAGIRLTALLIRASARVIHIAALVLLSRFAAALALLATLLALLTLIFLILVLLALLVLIWIILVALISHKIFLYLTIQPPMDCLPQHLQRTCQQQTGTGQFHTDLAKRNAYKGFLKTLKFMSWIFVAFFAFEALRFGATREILTSGF